MAESVAHWAFHKILLAIDGSQSAIEAARVAITRFLNRRGQVWIRIFPDKSVCKKPAETRISEVSSVGGHRHYIWVGGDGTALGF